MKKEVLEAKEAVVSEIVAKIKDSQSVTVAEYRGLSVAKIQEIRRALRQENAEMCVYKNSMMERAMKELGIEGMDEYLSGPNAVFFSKELSNGPKVVAKYAKRLGDALSIKGGIVEGKAYDKPSMLEVAKMPGREGLISMFLSCLQAPVRQFAATVKAVADAK